MVVIAHLLGTIIAQIQEKSYLGLTDFSENNKIKDSTSVRAKNNSC